MHLHFPTIECHFSARCKHGDALAHKRRFTAQAGCWYFATSVGRPRSKGLDVAFGHLPGPRIQVNSAAIPFAAQDSVAQDALASHLGPAVPATGAERLSREAFEGVAERRRRIVADLRRDFFDTEAGLAEQLTRLADPVSRQFDCLTSANGGR
jgi:hypothetical protein